MHKKYIAENSGPTAVFELSDGFEKLTFELPKFECYLNMDLSHLTIA